MPDLQLENGLVRTARMQEEEHEQLYEKQADEIIQEMATSREAIEKEVLKLAQLSMKLRTHVTRRRNALTTGYLAFSNAYMRICGALNQGLKRTATMGRVLTTAKGERDEAKLRDAREEDRRKMHAQEREIEKLSLPADDDFELVYGKTE